MIRDNVGFKILLNDHTELIEFRNIIKDYYDTTNKPFNVNIQFRNNPNYNRPKEEKVTSGQ